MRHPNSVDVEGNVVETKIDFTFKIRMGSNSIFPNVNALRRILKLKRNC